jgi:DNA-binding transcriptional regulator YhcF (GntR family)
MSTSDIRIDSSSDVSIRQQLIEQIIFRIATGAWTTDHQLPSVRELARRLKIHHNTVSSAYQDLVKMEWVIRHRGSRLAVISRDRLIVPQSVKSLDDIINLTIHVAQVMGYTLQELRERVRDRLKTASPDHILVIDRDEGLREILCDEIRNAMPYPVHACSPEDLASDPSLAIGALAVAPVYSIGSADKLFPKDRPVIAVTFNNADDHIRLVRELRQPSTIAVVSASPRFLEVARGVLASAIGMRHQLKEVLRPGRSLAGHRAIDLVFCDSIAKRSLRHPRLVHYQIASPKSLEEIAGAMKAYQIFV